LRFGVILYRRVLSRLLLFSYGSFVVLIIILFGVINYLLKFFIDSDNCIIGVLVPSIETEIVFRGRFHLHPSLTNHWITESLQKLQKVFEMMSITSSDILPRDVIEVIFDSFCDEIDNSLYLLPRGEVRVLIDAYQLDDSLRKDDLANIDIDVLAFQDLYLIDPSLYTHVLEDIYRQVYYLLCR
jgi:hypothetical protein